MRAIRVETYGGPEVLRGHDLEPPQPRSGEVQVDGPAGGVNCVATYQRSGTYQIPLPFLSGVEGAGTVTALGDGVTDLEVGDRVGWVAAPGSYAEQVLLPADKAIPVPE